MSKRKTPPPRGIRVVTKDAETGKIREEYISVPEWIYRRIEAENGQAHYHRMYDDFHDRGILNYALEFLLKRGLINLHYDENNERWVTRTGRFYQLSFNFERGADE